MLTYSGALDFYKSDSVKYGVLNVDEGLEEIGDTLITACNVIKLARIVFSLDFVWVLNFNDDDQEECNDKLAFAYGTGDYVVTINGDLPVPLFGRGTSGMVADETKEYGWAVEHHHESFDFEAAIEFLLDAYFSQESNAALVPAQIDANSFEEQISVLSEIKKLSWRKHVGDKYCKK